MSENAPANPDPLALLRTRESPALGAALADDPDLIRVAHAWAHADVTLTIPDDPPPMASPRLLWAWFWSGCDFDPDELAELSGISRNDAMIAFRRLKGLCMIYPDGTVARALGDFLIATASRALVEVR